MAWNGNNLSLDEAIDLAQNCPLYVYVWHYALAVVHARYE